MQGAASTSWAEWQHDGTRRRLPHGLQGIPACTARAAAGCSPKACQLFGAGTFTPIHIHACQHAPQCIGGGAQQAGRRPAAAPCRPRRPRSSSHRT